MSAQSEPRPETWLEPAATVVRKMGGVPMVARVLGLTHSAVYRWMWPQRPGPGESRGTGGLIPVRRQQEILEWSRRNGNHIKADDFFVPRSKKSRAA